MRGLTTLNNSKKPW